MNRYLEVGVSSTKRITYALCILILMGMIGITAQADTIRLRDGSILKGKVVSYKGGRFTIIVYIGSSSSQHVIPVEEVESVEFDGSDIASTGRTTELQPAARAVDVEETRPVEEPRVEARPVDTRPVEAPPVVEPRVEAERPVGEVDTGMTPVIAEKTVSVAAAADWTSTEIRVQRGQRIVVSASGEVDLGDGRRAQPQGIDSSDNRKLLPGKPTGSLIAVVGDDNDDFIFIGASSEFTAPHNGILFLSVNEGNLRDNNGAFVARIKVLSNR